MLVRPLASNTAKPIVWSVLPGANVTVPRLIVFWNAASPISETLAGIVTLVMAVAWNALFAIVVMGR